MHETPQYYSLLQPALMPLFRIVYHVRDRAYVHLGQEDVAHDGPELRRLALADAEPAPRDRGYDVSSALASGRFGRRRRSTLQRLERPRRVHRLLAVATDYVVEKLVDAVRSLAVSAAPIQQRLGNAWIGALVHLRPDDFDDPRERALFTNIRDAVTAWGDIETATDSMSDGQALAAAGDLVELLGTICLTLAVEREHPAKPD